MFLKYNSGTKNQCLFDGNAMDKKLCKGIPQQHRY